MKSTRLHLLRKVVGAALLLLGALNMSDLVGKFSPPAATQAAVLVADENVVWTNLVNTTASGNTIRKTGGRNDGTFDGNGISQQTITSNGTYEFKPTGPDVERVTGLTDSPSNAAPESFDFYINLSEEGLAEFRERGAYIGGTTYVNGDTFRIKLVNGRAQYSKNGTVINTGNLVLNSTLNAIASFGLLNGEVGSARLGNLSDGPTCAPPVIILGSNNYTVCEAEQWFVGAGSVLGTTPLTYVWKRNGVIIPGNTNVITGFAKLSDAGNYSVTVSNACGSATSTNPQILTVNTLSAISPTSNTMSATGGTGTINITSGRNDFGNLCGFGWDPPTGQWITSIARVNGPNGATLTYTVLPNTGVARSDVIRIYNPDRTRTFNFIVNQAAGTPTCAAPMVRITPTGPGLIGLTVCEGSPWTLTANVTGGVAPFTYQWTKNGAPIAGATGATLIKANATRSDNGTYNVTVTSACGASGIDTRGSGISLGVNGFDGFAGRSVDAAAAGGNAQFNVNVGINQTEDSCPGQIRATTNAPWITITGIRPDVRGAYSVLYTVAPNTGAARSGVITVTGVYNSNTGTVTVNQAGGGGGGGNVQDVIWTQLANATATGGTIRKTSGANDGSYDGGGISQQMFSNNGYYEFTVGGADVERVTGLTDTPTNRDFTTFDFYVNLSEGGIAEFRERGQYLSDTLYRVGDVFRITIENGRARYSKNGVTLANGTAFTSAPLKAIAALSLLNGEITQAKLGGLTGGCAFALTPTAATLPSSGGSGTVAVTAPGGCTWTAASNAPAWLTIASGMSGNGNGTLGYRAAANTGAQRTGTLTIAGQTFTLTQSAATQNSPDITWTRMRNVSLIGKTLRKTGGADDGTYDGEALAQELLVSGTGYLEFTVSGAFVRRSIGFTANFTPGQPDTIDYQLNLSDSDIIEFRYRGQYIGDAVYRIGDTIRLAVESGRIVAYVNARAFAETTVRPSYPLYVWASFSKHSGEISNAKLYTGQLPTLQQRRTPFDIYNDLPDDDPEALPGQRRRREQTNPLDGQ